MNTTTTTTTTTFHSIFKVSIIRKRIFNHIDEISKQQQKINNSNNDGDENVNIWLKGRDIVKLPFLGMIVRYAMPWDFIKHYLPSRENDNVLFERRMHTITKYCGHRNARLDTLKHLIDDWSPDYNPQEPHSNQQKQNAGLSIEYYSQLVTSIAAVGHVDLFEYLITRYPNINIVIDAKIEASEAGHLPILKSLDSINRGRSGLKDDTFDFRKAISNGHLNVVEYLTDKGFKYTGSISAAVQSGRLSLVKYLHYNQTGMAVSHDAMDRAATMGSLGILKFLHEHRPEGCSKIAMDKASEKGYLEVVKWLHENRSEGSTTCAMDLASSLEMIQYLHTHRTEGCSKTAMDYASGCGRLDVVKWLHENRSEGCSTAAIDRASKNGHFDVVKFLYDNRTEGCLSNAIHGVLDLEMVEFLFTNLGARSGRSTINDLVGRGRLDIIQFLHEHGDEGDDEDDGIWYYAMDEAAEQGNLEMVKWFHTNRTEGCTNYAMNHAAQKGYLEIVEFLHKHRTEGCTTFALDQAARGGHFEVVKFLHFNRTEGCTTDAIDGTYRLEIIQFLHKHRTEGCTRHVLHSKAPTTDDFYHVLKYVLDNNMLTTKQNILI
ncbi:hypothetical protein DFA_00317 [Cavenderia fasciculata]|uniref:Ankyrin repeat-containing protein n=1 Tax=Cavenderia fasciculata TaxID=261658 RepID=F4PY79_CACFS|nr:uncharacterized protein DFA_00317 [Cavenderia fasciculata]EGG19739.1 hypothetical protein DFA_00317 [Cavenderia fasciculata]|eukprot:XP_004358033.1 hypothetical protein DFA_00317 [Cavenderia fasciculata]